MFSSLTAKNVVGFTEGSFVLQTDESNYLHACVSVCLVYVFVVQLSESLEAWLVFTTTK